MNRLAACAAVGACVSLSACASSGPRPEITGLPPDCRSHPESAVTLTVSDTAEVSEPCIAVYQNTQITWKASSNVRLLVVAFKDSSHNPGNKLPPADPPVADSTARLKKGKTTHVQPNEDGYPYTVIVLRKDGTATVVDPRLIIQR